MPGRTLADKVEALQVAVARLEAVTEGLRDEVRPVDALAIRVAVLETQLLVWEKWALRIWAILGPVLTAAALYFLGLGR